MLIRSNHTHTTSVMYLNLCAITGVFREKIRALMGDLKRRQPVDDVALKTVEH